MWPSVPSLLPVPSVLSVLSVPSVDCDGLVFLSSTLDLCLLSLSLVGFKGVLVESVLTL